MTEHPVAEPSRRERRRRARRLRPMNVLMIAGALLGGLVFAYPFAAPWIADVIQASVVVRYEQTSAELDADVRDGLLEAAHDYNRHLPNGPLRDPYVINESGQAVSMEDGRADYERQLRIDPADPASAMARLSIPAIDVDLPIFHGTSEEVLSRGVGHLYGSGLPVGGRGVHAVLTAHSGYVSSRLFDDLPRIRLGDVFTITVLGETLSYRVDNIATTLPDESTLLRQVPGEDYVTLVTCTPRYVNTHRLLVRGTRIETPGAEDGGAASTQTVSAKNPGFPFWAFLAFGPAVTVAVLVRPRRSR